MILERAKPGFSLCDDCDRSGRWIIRSERENRSDHFLVLCKPHLLRLVLELKPKCPDLEELGVKI